MRNSDWSSDVCSSDLNTTYGGFNFMGGTVVETDIIAENGVIHEVDAVTLPQPSLDQSLREHDEYKIGRAPCREIVCQSVWISVVTVSLKKKDTHMTCQAYISYNKQKKINKKHK